MKIFLIAGKSRSGKGEVAKIIQNYYNEHNQKSVITEYSKYIKLYAREMLNWSGEEKNKPRKFLQDMGYFIRHTLVMPDFFINRMKEDIKIYEHFFDNIIISDVRYPKEMESIKQLFPESYSLHIIREDSEKNLSEEEANHESEHALENYNAFDFTIKNQEKEDLKEKIYQILEELS